MCGLIGLVSRNARHNARFLHGLYNNQDRGTDAYGIVGVSPAGAVNVFKRAGAVYNSVHKCRFINTAPVLMGHTRFATHGSAGIMINNHPFSVGNVVGMHNGVISNYQALATKFGYTLQSQCDSEVLFHLINSLESNDGIQDIIDEVCGYYVITWVDRRAPQFVNILRGGSSTSLSMVEITGVGYIYSSEKSHLPCFPTDKSRAINIPLYSLTTIDTAKMKMSVKEFTPAPAGNAYGKDWYSYGWSESDYDTTGYSTKWDRKKGGKTVNIVDLNKSEDEVFESTDDINAYYDCNLKSWCDIATGVPVARELVPNGGLLKKERVHGNGGV